MFSYDYNPPTACRWGAFCCVVVALLVALAMPAGAQDAATEDAEDSAAETYLDLRRSDDRTAQLLAERYFNLVRRQEWVDSTGKNTVMARYVEHDPDQEWVKLKAVRGRGEERVEKEITVPVARLSKACQSRVRQIATLQAKLDELLATAGEAETSGEPAFSDPGSPMVDERGVEPPRPATRPSPDESASAIESPPAPRAALYEDPSSAGFDPDPLGFAEIDFSSTPSPGGAETGSSPGLLSRPPEPSSAPGAVPQDANQPTSTEELQTAFAKAFEAGDKHALEKLIYWGDLSEEDRQATRAMMNDAGQAKNLEVSVASRDASNPDRWTVKSNSQFNIKYETQSAGNSLDWGFGEIGGKYYLGAWDIRQPTSGER